MDVIRQQKAIRFANRYGFDRWIGHTKNTVNMSTVVKPLMVWATRRPTDEFEYDLVFIWASRSDMEEFDTSAVAKVIGSYSKSIDAVWLNTETIDELVLDNPFAEFGAQRVYP